MADGHRVFARACRIGVPVLDIVYLAGVIVLAAIVALVAKGVERL
ncbi:hypothetical protein [Orlajensenia flava]|nr:hypothetical protein [Glaciibacter flavus]